MSASQQVMLAVSGGVPLPVIDGVSWNRLTASAPPTGAGDLVTATVTFHDGQAPFSAQIKNGSDVLGSVGSITNGGTVSFNVYANAAGYTGAVSVAVHVTDALGRTVVSSPQGMSFYWAGGYYSGAPGVSDTTPSVGTFISITAGSEPASSQLPGDMVAHWSYTLSGYGSQNDVSAAFPTYYTPTLNWLGNTFFQTPGQTYNFQCEYRSASLPSIYYYAAGAAGVSVTVVA